MQHCCKAVSVCVCVCVQYVFSSSCLSYFSRPQSRMSQGSTCMCVCAVIVLIKLSVLFLATTTVPHGVSHSTAVQEPDPLQAAMAAAVNMGRQMPRFVGAAFGNLYEFNEKYGIRLTDVVSAQERVKKLR